jgi:uncharacterized membrane protein
MNAPLTPQSPQDVQSSPQWKITQVVYILQAAAFFVGITYIAAIIVNYLKLDEVRGTWLESHFIWQMRTFLFSILGWIVGGATLLVGIGHIILLATTLWTVYRIAQGWLNLLSNKPMSVSSYL